LGENSGKFNCMGNGGEHPVPTRKIARHCVQI
jgi:hypothetical protein